MVNYPRVGITLAAQRPGVQLPAPGERINKSLLVFKMHPILWSPAGGAGQRQRWLGRPGPDTALLRPSSSLS
jgi:hypothetical protein